MENDKQKLSKEEQEALIKKRLEDDEKALNDWLEKSENRKFLTEMQEELRKRFSDNWFTIEQVIKKTSYKNPPQVLKLMAFLKFGKYVISKPSFKPKQKAIEIFKVLKSTDNLITLKQIELKEMEDYINYLLTEKSKIQSELDNLINNLKLEL